jgi:hypothetical protein
LGDLDIRPFVHGEITVQERRLLLLFPLHSSESRERRRFRDFEA